MTDQKTPDASSASLLSDGLSDPFQAVLDTIDGMKEFGMTSLTRPIGFVTINGVKAQVKICVDSNRLNWVRSDNVKLRGAALLRRPSRTKG